MQGALEAYWALPDQAHATVGLLYDKYFIQLPPPSPIPPTGHAPRPQVLTPTCRERPRREDWLRFAAFGALFGLVAALQTAANLNGQGHPSEAAKGREGRRPPKRGPPSWSGQTGGPPLKQPQSSMPNGRPAVSRARPGASPVAGTLVPRRY